MPGGLEWEELASVLRPLLAAPGLLGMSLGCYDPGKDPDRSCGRRLVELLGGA
jgi:arginase